MRLSISVLATLLSVLPVRASEADALAISRNIQARHLIYGSILDPVFATPENNQIVGYTRCGDSATWSGHYLAAEAFRYKVIRSPEALDNVKRVLEGIKVLLDVTGTNLLARCALPMDSPYAQYISGEEQHNGIFTNVSARYLWVGNTSRDQYSGVFFGVGVAFDMVDDAGVKSAIKALVPRLLNFLRGHNWNIVMPDGSVVTSFVPRPDQQLSFLQVASHTNPDQFSTFRDDLDRVAWSPGVLAPIGFDVQSDSSYFKFNIDYINLYNLIRLENGAIGGAIYQKAFDLLRNHTEAHQNAFFNMIDRGVNGPNPKRDAETPMLLEAWLSRPRRDDYVDLRNVYGTCGSPDEACNPLPVPQRVRTDFLWQRSPFLLVGGGDGRTEGPGIDYILPYWMARFYGIASALTGVSAADRNPAVAPASLASLFGENLATQTQPATSLPFPPKLGGIDLQVRDSAGVPRAAPLLYVSPTQINFEIPAGTAAGQATLIINGNAAPLNGTAQIQKIAPGIFTANADGHGVAAALFLRTFVNGQQTAAPIFECTAPGNCTPIQIDLGVDTPVYLSLYGTGIRNRSSLSAVTCTINGVTVPVLYAGPQLVYDGLDQVNLSLPLSLRNTGGTDLVLTVDGLAANTVRVNIK